MKMVINTEYGAFSLGCVAEVTGKSDCLDRDDPWLVALVEAGIPNADPHCLYGGPSQYLKVVEIPEEARDIVLREYDGRESCYYRLAGGQWINAADPASKLVLDPLELYRGSFNHFRLKHGETKWERIRFYDPIETAPYKEVGAAWSRKRKKLEHRRRFPEDGTVWWLN